MYPTGGNIHEDVRNTGIPGKVAVACFVVFVIIAIVLFVLIVKDSNHDWWGNLASAGLGFIGMFLLLTIVEERKVITEFLSRLKEKKSP